MSWRIEAACKDSPTELWFSPGDGDDPRNDDYSVQTTWVARSICSTCPVQHECLEDALEHGEPHGIRGGLDPKERRKIMLKRAREANLR